MEVSDATAVAQALAGESDAFRLLVERHGRKVFQLAYRLTGNETDAEDIVQETFLRVHRNLGQFDQRSVFTTWLYRIATNYTLDVLRARKAKTSISLSDDGRGEGITDRIASDWPGPERTLLSSELNERIGCAMSLLTVQERAAFTLRHFEGHTVEEISSALKLSAVGARQTIFRAVQKMRRALEPLVEGAKWTT